MNYTVVWKPDSKNDLADLWIAAHDRAALTKAANFIDRLLGQNPFANSEARAGNSRIMIVTPLAVAYDVSEDDRLVTVWAVWKTTK
jgi:plasmid stabilization system protein ParE